MILSDEDDCSTPADFAEMSSKLVCRPNGTLDENNNRIPDIYESDVLTAANSFVNTSEGLTASGLFTQFTPGTSEFYCDSRVESNRRHGCMPESLRWRSADAAAANQLN